MGLTNNNWDVGNSLHGTTHFCDIVTLMEYKRV